MVYNKTVYIRQKVIHNLLFSAITNNMSKNHDNLNI